MIPCGPEMPSERDLAHPPLCPGGTCRDWEGQGLTLECGLVWNCSLMGTIDVFIGSVPYLCGYWIPFPACLQRMFLKLSLASRTRKMTVLSVFIVEGNGQRTSSVESSFLPLVSLP